MADSCWLLPIMEHSEGLILGREAFHVFMENFLLPSLLQNALTTGYPYLHLQCLSAPPRPSE